MPAVRNSQAIKYITGGGGCLIFFIYKKCVRQYANNTFSRLVIQFEFDLISAHFQLA